LSILFRVYDDYLRYEILWYNCGSIEIEQDITPLLTSNWYLWSFNGEIHGPAKISEVPDTVQTPFHLKNANGRFILFLKLQLRISGLFYPLKTSTDIKLSYV